MIFRLFTRQGKEINPLKCLVWGANKRKFMLRCNVCPFSVAFPTICTTRTFGMYEYPINRLNEAKTVSDSQRVNAPPPAAIANTDKSDPDEGV